LHLQKIQGIKYSGKRGEKETYIKHVDIRTTPHKTTELNRRSFLRRKRNIEDALRRGVYEKKHQTKRKNKT